MPRGHGLPFIVGTVRLGTAPKAPRVHVNSPEGGVQLVHYTGTVDAVVSILENGFLFVPNRREVIDNLLGPDLFKDREPQQFGMVSFTEVRSGELSRHREHFGSFGIAVSPHWAIAHNAQRVIYVDRAGPVLETLRWLFALGKQELNARLPESETDPMALTNKAMAGMYGAGL